MNSQLKTLLLAALLGACSSTFSPPPPPQAETPTIIGPWAALPVSCQVRGHTEDFTISTTGHVENHTLRLYLTFKSQQAGAPQLTITGLTIPLAPEGRSPVYGYTLPFTPYVATKLTDPTSHFHVTYYNVGASQGYESNLPTASFIKALASLATTCP